MPFDAGFLVPKLRKWVCRGSRRRWEVTGEIPEYFEPLSSVEAESVCSIRLQYSEDNSVEEEVAEDQAADQSSAFHNMPVSPFPKLIL